MRFYHHCCSHKEMPPVVCNQRLTALKFHRFHQAHGIKQHFSKNPPSEKLVYAPCSEASASRYWGFTEEDAFMSVPMS